MASSPLFLAVLLSICCLVYGQGDNCVRTVFLLPCASKLCVKLNTRTGCYTCKENCGRDGDGSQAVNNTCDPMISSSCEDNEICLSVGIAGQNTCVDRIDEGEFCEREDQEEDLVDKLRASLSDFDGISERQTLSSLGSSIVPCRRGLVCRRESSELRTYCRRENQTACFQERNRNSEIECSNDGNYAPLQCRRSNGRLVCQCFARNGSAIDGTETTVENRGRAPDCENRKCRQISRMEVVYQIESGASFIDYTNCRLCKCRAGESTECQSLRSEACSNLNPPSRERINNCMVDGETVRDGAIVQRGCRKCRCRNGTLQCPKVICENEEEDKPVDEEDRKCSGCRKEASVPVCGNDGKTYASLCKAINCRGLNNSRVTVGPCNRKDVCSSYQCNDTDVCVRQGGVTCLSKFGCRTPERFRRCVNLQNLQCSNNASDETAVCGSDGKTYTSRCKLLQSAAGIRVAYGNQCDDPKCSGGQVCGTDGETYSNVCELEAQSSNVRVDYRGECMETSSSDVLVDKCQRVRASGRCADVSDCKTVIPSRDGCCRICGGGLTIAFDRDALEEYLSVNPSVETVDDMSVRILLSDLISEEDRNRCNIKFSLLDEGDLFIAFEAKSRADDYCMRASERVAETINNPSADTSTSVAIPQELQFATVAESSSLISEDPTSAGGRKSAKQLSAVVLATALLFIAILF